MLHVPGWKHLWGGSLHLIDTGATPNIIGIYVILGIPWLDTLGMICWYFSTMEMSFRWDNYTILYTGRALAFTTYNAINIFDVVD